jgi:hypothetical protein
MPRTKKISDRKALEVIIKECLKSASFRRRLENDPGDELTKLGIHTEKREKALRGMRWGSLQKLAASFGYDRFLRGSDAN